MRRSGEVMRMLAVLFCIPTSTVFGQAMGFTAVRAGVDFSKHLREWDGFGVNYVEVARECSNLHLIGT